MKRDAKQPRRSRRAVESSAATLLQRSGDEAMTFATEAMERRGGVPPRLREAMRYSLLAGGKRLRPTLVLRCFDACGGAATLRRTALAAAAAIELVHTFSLIHDDLPAMDDDDLRRGQPTCHKAFGEATAILAGDGLLALAFELLAVESDRGRAPLLIAELARATGPSGMVGGQQLDIESESRVLQLSELQHLHRLKTGALLTAACRLGAIAAVAEPSRLERLTLFGGHLGLAFQIVDDLLDVTSNPGRMGKRTGKDVARGKNTYPSLLGVAEARRQARAQLRAALATIAPLGKPAEPLRVLARFVVDRRH